MEFDCAGGLLATVTPTISSVDGGRGEGGDTPQLTPNLRLDLCTGGLWRRADVYLAFCGVVDEQVEGSGGGRVCCAVEWTAQAIRSRTKNSPQPVLGAGLGRKCCTVLYPAHPFAKVPTDLDWERAKFKRPALSSTVKQ
jgi:hypothetical protein